MNVRSKLLVLMASTVVGTGLTPAVFAADDGAQTPADIRTDIRTREVDKEIDTRDMEARLEDARARLEEAAHEVAELSSQMSGPLMDKFMVFNDEAPSRAVIGVQLDTAAGKEGARIQEVSPGGPADEAGLRVGDVITQFNGTDVKGERAATDVTRLIRKVAPDSKVNVRVLRDGKPRDFVVTPRRNQTFLGMHAPMFVAPIPPIPPLPPGVPEAGVRTFGPVMIHGSLGDMELATMTPQLGRYFGTDKGVLVVRAPKDFKLEDGDVILAIDGREPTSGSHATRILSSYQPGEKIAIKVMRQQKAVNVETTLPERHAFIDRDGDDSERGRKTKIRMMPHKGLGGTT
jgi:C-terminal processing protease CtpA/Prc